MKSVPTFTATIYAGLRVGRTADHDAYTHLISEVTDICQAYCDEVGLCVTTTPTRFVYTGGGEPGCIVGLINYPRFPSDPMAIREHALELAERIRIKIQQHRISIVFPDETVMIGEGPHDDPQTREEAGDEEAQEALEVTG